MQNITHTAILGAGTIGASWAALFLASGRSVAIFDPAPDAERTTRAYIDRAWPTLTELGLTDRGSREQIQFFSSAASAVEGADFIQENVPERLPIKHATFAEIEPFLGEHTITASSASGLTLSEMQKGWKTPTNFVLGHPFNPPHLIPLVEIIGNSLTAADTVERAEAFYKDLGKVTIRVNKELPGHVANRLQAAIWREAIHLIVEGVASVEDVDKAIWAGPGLRWAAMGPTTLFHLGAGDGGLEAFCDHFSDTFNGWWKGLGKPSLDENTRAALVAGVKAATDGQSISDLAVQRDALITEIRKATGPLRD